MNHEQSLIKALLELSDNKGSFSILNSANNHIRWDSTDITRPSDEEISNKANEILNAEPMRLLREERDRKLAETDWWAGKDVTMSQARKDYRQALRDLPSNAEPQLDAEGNLTNVTWPTKPT
jgi:hypothetical protein